MLAVARSFAREFWGPNRRVLVPALAYLAALVVVVNVTAAGTLDPKIVGQLALPLGFVVPYLIAIFAHGEQADVIARESGYPRRAFTLPVPTSALVGWPMGLGIVAVVGYWLVMGALVLRSAGLPVPLLWPAAFAAGLLALTQALVWLPFPLPVLRVLVLVPVLSGLVATAIVGFVYEVSPTLLLAASASLVPVGYLLALAGVARARRGDVPEYRWPILQRPAAESAPRAPFASPAAALTWLEWRGNLFLAPLFAILVLVPLMLLLFLVSNLHVLPMLLPGMAMYPLMMAFLAGVSLGNCRAWARHLPTMPVFLAARPTTNAALLAVKHRAAVVTTLGTWALIILALAITLPLCPAGEEVVGWIRTLLESQGVPRGSAWLLLIAVGLPALTWKVTVDQFWIGLCGRYWVTVVAIVGIPSAMTMLAVFLASIYAPPSLRESLLAAIPWTVGTAFAVKLAAGVWIAWALLRREMITPRAVAWLAASWLVAAVGVMGLALWLIPPALDASLVIGAAAVVLGLPLVRLGLAPLALEWNRHR